MEEEGSEGTDTEPQTMAWNWRGASELTANACRPCSIKKRDNSLLIIYLIKI